MLLLNFVAIMVAFKFWGKMGLFIWIPISVIVANIQVTKTVQLFGLEATLGNIVYATSFLATDILSECFGKTGCRQSGCDRVLFLGHDDHIDECGLGVPTGPFRFRAGKSLHDIRDHAQDRFGKPCGLHGIPVP